MVSLLLLCLPLLIGAPGYYLPDSDLDRFLEYWQASPQSVAHGLQDHAEVQAAIVAKALFREVGGDVKPPPPQRRTICSGCYSASKASEPATRPTTPSFSPSKTLAEFFSSTEKGSFVSESVEVGRMVHALFIFDQRETFTSYAEFFADALTSHLTDAPASVISLLVSRLSEARALAEDDSSSPMEGSARRKRFATAVVRKAGLDLVLGALGAPVVPDLSPAESFEYLRRIESLLASAFQELYPQQDPMRTLTYPEPPLNNVDLELARLFYLSYVKSRKLNFSNLANSALQMLGDVEWADMSSGISALKKEFGAFVEEGHLALVLESKRKADYGRFISLNSDARLKEEILRLQSHLLEAIRTPAALSSPSSVLGLLMDQADLWNLVKMSADVPPQVLQPLIPVDEGESLILSVWRFLDPLQQATLSSWVIRARNKHSKRCGHDFHAGRYNHSFSRDLEFASRSFRLPDDLLRTLPSFTKCSYSRVPRLNLSSSASPGTNSSVMPTRQSLRETPLSSSDILLSHPNSSPPPPLPRFGASQGAFPPFRAPLRSSYHEASPSSCRSDDFEDRVYSSHV